MSSFIFNEFKKRFLNGEVKNNGTKWFFQPVKKDFIDNLSGENIKPEQFKTKKAIETYLKNYDDVTSKLYTVEYEYSKLVETKYSNKPAYITPENFSDFFRANPKEGALWNFFFTAGQADSYFANRGGFYFVKTKEELKWCANRVNGDDENGERGDNFNNHINIVLGDDIGEYVDFTEINFTIGRYTDRPFEGVFFGNGFVFNRLKFKVTGTVGGLVGYLGHNGWINNIYVFGDTVVECEKKINLNHIKNSAEDICFGVICAVNRGLIQNCRISGEAKDKQNNIPTITYKGFVPSVYLVQNKTENLNVPVSDSKDNEFFPNYFCINSPGNIVPYVGYFAEGCPSIVSARPWTPKGPQPAATPCWLDDTDEKNKIADWTGTMLLSDNKDEEPGIPADENGFGNQFLTNYANVKKTVDTLGYNNVRSDSFGFDCMIPDLAGNKQHQQTHQIVYNYASNWSNQPVKMHQFARAAYYVSPFCGSNKGTIESCESRTKAVFEGTFVGFCGGLVGKSGGGKINGCNVYIEPQDDAYATRDKLVVSAAENIAAYTPHIDLQVSKWNWTDVYHQDLDDIKNRNDDTNQYKDYMISAADLYQASEGDPTNRSVLRDPLGICQCPWYNTTQGIMFQFDGLSANSARAITHEFTFDDSSHVELVGYSGNSALDVYNNAINTGDYSENSGYSARLVSDVIQGMHEIHTNTRMHRSYYDQETYNSKPKWENDTSAYAVWFPMVKNSDSKTYYNVKFNPDVNCYEIENVEFDLGCGYEVVKSTQNYNDHIVDQVYPDFFDENNNYLLRTQKECKYNYPDENSQTFTSDAWSATSANDDNHTKIDRLSCSAGNFTCGIEFDTSSPYSSDAVVYQQSKDFVKENVIQYKPKVYIEKMYLLPMNGNNKSDHNSFIKKYINNDTVYIEGFPLAIARVEGVHIKNRYSSIKPKSSTNEKTVITITDYEIYIKSFGHEAGACYSPNSLYPQWNGIDKKGHLQGKSIHYNWSSTFDTYKSRIYIGNCGTEANNVFELEDDYTLPQLPVTSINKPSIFINIYVNATGESFYSELQSIYNVGGLIGSLAIAPKVTEIYNTSAFLNNKISEGLSYSAIKETDKDTGEIKDRIDFIWNDVSSKNYSYLDRFGGLAAICEFNTSNMSNNQVRPIQMTNVNLHYEEETGVIKKYRSSSVSWNMDLDTTVSAESAISALNSRYFYGPIQLNGDNPTCPFGIGSPIVAEIKPTYNMFPGINSYMNSWKGDQPNVKDSDVEKDTTHPHEVNGYAYYGEFSNDLGLMYNDFNLGLYTMDLNCDTPIENMYRDVTNETADATGLKYGWMPGLKNGNAEAVSLCGIPNLAESLFRGCHVKQNYYGTTDADHVIHQGPGYRRMLGVLGTVHYPASLCRDLSLSESRNHVYWTSDGKNGNYQYNNRAYQTSKHESTYSYFGSSLAIDNTTSGKRVYNDVLISFGADPNACPTDGPDLTEAKLPVVSMSFFKTRNEEDQFFTYTYTADYTSANAGELPKQPLMAYDIEFGRSDNGKIGYWLSDPVVGISGDNFVYNNNIIHMGITKSPEQIRKEIMDPNGNGKCKTSALSGDEFAGIYVYDNDGNNVMYIETNMGESNGLSTWSMQLEEGKFGNQTKGCILEIK